jgi:EpsI family protein
MSFLKSKYARALTLVLLLQTLAFYAIARRPENVPSVAMLSFFPNSFDGWLTVKDIPVEKEVQDVLKADDLLNRVYVNPTRTEEASLFIAFFKTQRYGQSPHSPKNCLPGSGWEKVSDQTMPVMVPGWSAPIGINRYVVEHGDEKDVTLYWYHSHNRVIAGEMEAKFWAVADSIRYHRSDTALIRVIVPVRGGDVDSATNTGVQFVQALFPQILKQLPL